jgi:hypothetical protein
VVVARAMFETRDARPPAKRRARRKATRR